MDRVSILVILIPAFIIGSCAATDARYRYKGPSITGCVTDSRSNPLEAVAVELVSSDGKIIWKGRTDSDGRFLFSSKNRRNRLSFDIFGDRTLFVTVKIYKNNILRFSGTYDVLDIARKSDSDHSIASLDNRNKLPEGMADVYLSQSSCFII